MKERGIIFSSPMVKAILDGRKSMTRRVIKPQPPCALVKLKGDNNLWSYTLCDKNWKCPYGQPGDMIWVRETFCIESNFNIESGEQYQPPFNDGRPIKYSEDPDYGNYWEQCHYRATDPTPELSYENDEGPTCHWRPSLFMFRWMSRITLEIINVRVERLQEITYKDVEKEGINLVRLMPLLPSPTIDIDKLIDFQSKRAFSELWDSINGKKKYPWGSNPLVWCISFKRLTREDLKCQ